jgi:sulfur-carrier protein adenylyltransferase/sulfurtransferase
MLSSDELSRYSRQTLLPQVGVAGQERLKASSVLLIGAGGLGSPLALYLAAAGVGRLGIAEFDAVDLSNLHRQVLFATSDVGRSKLEAASERIRALNPHVELVPHPVKLEAGNAAELLAGYDLVADGSDTFATRYTVNDAAVQTGVPVVFGSVSQFEGQVSVFAHSSGPCYRCLFPEPPPPELVPSCAEGGVLGVVPGMVGILQATEALKLLLGIGSPAIGRVITIDALGARFRELRVARDPACPVCGDRPSPPSPLPQPDRPMSVPEITVQELKDRLDHGDRPFMLDVRRSNEAEIANIGGHLIPVDELPQRLDEIAEHRGDEIVVYCRTGGRSARAVELLRAQGFEGAVNLRGGTHAWSDEIDPSMPKY